MYLCTAPSPLQNVWRKKSKTASKIRQLVISSGRHRDRCRYVWAWRSTWRHQPLNAPSQMPLNRSRAEAAGATDRGLSLSTLASHHELTSGALFHSADTPTEVSSTIHTESTGVRKTAKRVRDICGWIEEDAERKARKERTGGESATERVKLTLGSIVWYLLKRLRVHATPWSLCVRQRAGNRYVIQHGLFQC